MEYAVTYLPGRAFKSEEDVRENTVWTMVLRSRCGVPDEERHTVPDFDRQWCRFASVCRDGQLDEAGPCIEGSVLVEDEVADAVIDRFSPVGLDRLKRVAVVSYDGIRPGIDQSVRFFTLSWECP